MDIHQSLINAKAGLHVTCAGAGAELFHRIWSNTGVSTYFLGADFPYAPGETSALLGFDTEGSIVSETTAYDLAMSSYIKACQDSLTTGRAPIGLGVTAAVASERMPKGRHRAHICVVYKDSVLYESLDLIKDTGKEARKNHDRIIASHCQYMLERVLRAETDLACEEVAISRLLEHPVFCADGSRRTGVASNTNLFMPATLNPLHDGHRAIRAAAEAVEFEPATYLVSAVSPHKGNRTVQELLSIVAQVKSDRTIGQCRDIAIDGFAPLFIDKARKYPESMFIIGTDTMRRMLDPQWGPEIPKMLEEMRNLGTRFLVADRIVDGYKTTCRDIPVPWPNQVMFFPLVWDAVEISSTQLRKAADVKA